MVQAQAAAHPELGLLVISDTPLRSNTFYAMPPPPRPGRLTLAGVNRAAWALLVVGLGSIAAIGARVVLAARQAGLASLWQELDEFLALGVPLVLALGLVAALLWGRWKVSRVLEHLGAVVHAPWRRLRWLTVNDAVAMFSLRLGSLFALTDDVFMHRIRSLNYATVYAAPGLRDRVLASEIYALLAPSRRPQLPAWLVVTPAMAAIARQASTMGTRLWLEPPPPGQHGELDVLIACGQITIYYNVVEHLALRHRRPDGTFPDPRLAALFARAEADWGTLTRDPFAFVPRPDGPAA